MDCSPPGSSVHGIFQARILEWGAIALLGSNSLLRFYRFRGEGARPVLPCWGSCWVEKAQCLTAVMGGSGEQCVATYDPDLSGMGGGVWKAVKGV